MSNRTVTSERTSQHCCTVAIIIPVLLSFIPPCTLHPALPYSSPQRVHRILSLHRVAAVRRCCHSNGLKLRCCCIRPTAVNKSHKNCQSIKIVFSSPFEITRQFRPVFRPFDSDQHIADSGSGQRSIRSSQPGFNHRNRLAQLTLPSLNVNENEFLLVHNYVGLRMSEGAQYMEYRARYSSNFDM